MRLPRYEAMRPSGMDWLGEVPAHWKLGRLKTFAQIDPPLRERPGDDDAATFLPMERVSARGGFDGSIERQWGEAGTYTAFERDDVLLAKITPCFENGKAAHLGELPTKAGFGSTEFIVLRARNGTDPRYLFRVIHLDGFRRYGITSMKGSAGQQRVPPAFVANVNIPLPPPDEQAAIVRFLNHAVGRLDRAIAAKRRVVRLLEEQRRAVVHRAVTRGLDPDARMVDSGVPWLGEVPEGWSNVRGKNIWRERDERSKSGEEELLSVSHITGVSRRSGKNVTMFKASSYIGSKLCEGQDLVVNTMWAWMGAMGIARERGIVSPSYGVYAPIAAYEADFIEGLLTHPAYVGLYNIKSKGITSSRARLYPKDFLSLPFFLPPYEDQVSIVEEFSVRTQEIRRSIEVLADEITLLEEYRTALVSEVVTGRRDVRAAAATLPAPPAPADNLEAFDAGEDDFEDTLIEAALAP